MGELFFKPDTLMGNKEEQGLSPAVPTPTHIHQPASQPATSQPTSWGPSWKEVFSANLFPSCLTLNGAIHKNSLQLVGTAAMAHL